MTELVLLVIVLLVLGAAGCVLIFVPRALERARAEGPGLRAPDPKQIEARREMLTERDAAVRAHAQAVAVAGSEDRAAARVENVDDPVARRLLQALGVADDAPAELDAPNRGAGSLRAQARTVRGYGRAVRALEDAWRDLGSPPTGAGRPGAPGPLPREASRRLSRRRDGDQ